MRRRGAIALLLLVAACRQERAPATAEIVVDAPPDAAPKVVARAEDDLPLPDDDAIPAFLRGGIEQPPPLPVEVELEDPPDPATLFPPEREPSLRELMRSVQIHGSEEVPPELEDTLPAWAPLATAEDTGFDERGWEDPSPAEEELEPVETQDEGDSCASLREALESRRDFLRRVGAERDTWAYVANDEDAHALRLLASMRRCAEHPEDEDCRAPPIEQDVSELEPETHTYERQPGELEAEKKQPDEMVHDPRELALLRQLQQCERAKVRQPLLDKRR